MGCSTSGFSPARPLRCRSASCPGSRASPICLPVRRGRTSSSWSSASSWRRVGALSRRHCASWGAIVIPPSAQSAARVGSPTDLPGNLNRTGLMRLRTVSLALAHWRLEFRRQRRPREFGLSKPRLDVMSASDVLSRLDRLPFGHLRSRPASSFRARQDRRRPIPASSPAGLCSAQGSAMMSFPDGRFIPLGQSSTPSMIFALWRARRRLLHGATPSVI